MESLKFQMSSLKHGGKRHTPLPKGPYTVGCIDIMTGYSNRSSFIRLYYPCVEIGTIEHKDQWPRWADDEYLDGYAEYPPLPKFISKKFIHLLCSKIYIPAILDGKPLTKEKPFPVIVFSHGLYACRTTYSAIHVELASQGYIVASVEHRDQSACYSFYMKKSRMSKYGPYPGSDISEVDEEVLDTEIECEDSEKYQNAPIEKRRHGSEMTSKQHVLFHSVRKPISRRHADLRNKQMCQRAEECIRALDVLEDINNGITVKNVLQSKCSLENFHGLLDMSKVCMAGHSFGGATTLKVLSMEKRFRTGITLDAWTVPLIKETELASLITQPILFINSSYFYTRRTLEELHQFDSNETERIFATLKKTIHNNQCDLPFVIPRLFLLLSGEILRGNSFTHLKLINRLIMTFLSKHLDLNFNASFNDYIKSKSSHIKENVVF
ncbi:platelet-activating factor acetylhydrolase-like isoform X1 [Centruroides sculpturatus]|uniref:platelet-activating factor acetylhydrolase-like isoform X1 n=1 Tax=Centruroides sculpturatus TaxID=218467 RepID=UPI000C6D9E69|nr:platelet-activating factor acetylhydrolase-like isoform X1 [Centruroides sculpturatus]